MKNKNIGFFLCKCGTNIANFMDCEELSSWAEKRNDLCFVKTHDLLCSPAGKQFMEETLNETDAEAVVIAACSPKMHEKTFQDVAAKSKMNMAKVHLANIREHCGWVTSDKQEATEKSKKLINAAIQRSEHHEDLEQKYMECCSDIAIIGGGIAGIEAALLAAESGRNVIIIEKEISLGGNIIKTEEVAPSMECAPCLLAPRLTAIKDHENITVISNAEVTDVLGFFGNFTLKIVKKPRYVKDSCIGCEACFDVCPVSKPSAFHLGLGEKKAIYTAFPGSVPAAAAIDKQSCKHFEDNSCDACVSVCPFESINFDDQEEETTINAGAIIVAVGCDSADVSHIKELGYGSIANVVTLPEFERLASSNGPFFGQIQMANGKAPGSIAVLHCAGSLTQNGLSYCSGYCCTAGLKVGELLRKQESEAVVTNIHNRLVFETPESETFFRKQAEEGTHFIRTEDLSLVSVQKHDNGIKITGKGFEPVIVDMLVLATGMVPAHDLPGLAENLDIARTSEGFIAPDHAILNGTGATIDGVLAAGSCISPCGTRTAITRAHAAAGTVLSKLVPGKKIKLEVMTSVIDDTLCAGCKLCISVCPYKAITFDSEKTVSIVNEAICRGCGTCTATCPSGAATAKHFTDTQIYAEIGGIING